MDDTLLVRLKPHDPKRRFVLRRYVYRGIHFLANRGWERVPKEVGEYLRGVRQKTDDAYAPPAFDVCTQAEAERIDIVERQAATTQRPALEAIETAMPRRHGNVVTTGDLPGRREPLESDDEPRGNVARTGSRR